MQQNPSADEARESRLGALYAIGAYTLWGLLVFYWRALSDIPLWTTLAHRVLWSLFAVLAILAVTRKLPAFFRTLSDARLMRTLALSSLLIGANWSLYVWTVYSHQVVQASLGYYVNPLMNVALGVAVLRERLTALQKWAVLLAAAGVLLLGWEHRGLPWIALSLALTFTTYGFIKKRVRVEVLVGLGVETLWMAPLAGLYLGLLAANEAGRVLPSSPTAMALLIGAGPVTLAPLLFFNGAARRLRLSTLGFFQYLSPSIQLLLAVAFFHEPFTPLHWAAFGCIWTALALYSGEGLIRKRNAGH